jgi:hypothetical protein
MVEAENAYRWSILRWILERCTGLVWPSMGTSGGLCENDNETFGSIKCWEVL